MLPLSSGSIPIMFDRYHAAGSSSSLYGMRERIRHRRFLGYWPAEGSRLARMVEAEIDALVSEVAEASASRFKQKLVIARRRHEAIRARYEGAQS
jgi:hypothetical protein